MANVARLDIGLHSYGGGATRVDLRFDDTESAVEIQARRSGRAQFDFRKLLELEIEHQEYGELLWKSLLSDDELRQSFRSACSVAEAKALPLRLRLTIGGDSPDLHNIRWETLKDPDLESGYATSERITFSRYASTSTFRFVDSIAKSNHKAAIAVANPKNLESQHNLAPIDLEEELKHALDAFQDIEMAPPLVDGAATIDNIIEHARSGATILYVVCRGILRDDTPYLILEKPDRQSDVVPGSELVARIEELRCLPYLIVLATCDSAGTGDTVPTSERGSLAALAARLVVAGVPAVLAMQGEISTQTAAKFMTEFFKQLQDHGEVDRAVAVARSKIRDEADWWAPVLYSRLKSGRIWSTRGWSKENDRVARWPSLVGAIKQGQCTPLLGPGMSDALIGSREEIARDLAEKHDFPMAPHKKQSLPQVTQYLASKYDRNYAKTETESIIMDNLKFRYRELLSDNDKNEEIDQIIRRVGKEIRKSNPSNPHSVMARLKVPMYLVSNLSSLLVDALVEEDREPEIEIFRWNSKKWRFKSVSDRNRKFKPTIERPLVLYLYGYLCEPLSLVLTEDDYFDYLCGTANELNPFYQDIFGEVVSSSLLVLGYDLDSWNFRVLFRSLMNLEGSDLLEDFTHVAAQVKPQEGRFSEPDSARDYLEKYFGAGPNISIYWGTVEELARDLDVEMV